MNSRRALVVIMLLSATPAQWTSLDLSSASRTGFSSQVEPLLVGTSLYLGHQPTHLHPPGNRLHYGFSLAGGVDFSSSNLARRSLRAFPALHGSYLVTSNLSLVGKLAGFVSGPDLVQMQGYGIDLALSDKPSTNWFLTLTLSALGGAEDLRCRSIDALVRKATPRLKIPLQYGLGTNLYKAHITMAGETSLPDLMKGQTNYLFCSASLPLGSLRIGFQAKIHPKFIAGFVDLSGTFH